MQELGRTGKYFDKNPNIIKVESAYKSKDNQDLKVIPGYRINLLPYNKKFVLQVDICNRVLQASNFKEELLREINFLKELKVKKSMD